MKTILHIHQWLFVTYAISIPLLIIFISISKGVGQGLQFILIPPIVTFFLILIWWSKSLVKYISIRIQPATKKEDNIIVGQILWLIIFVAAPMFLLTIFIIWNRFDRHNPITDIAKQSYIFLMSTGIITSIMGLISIIYYSKKSKKINLSSSL